MSDSYLSKTLARVAEHLERLAASTAERNAAPSDGLAEAVVELTAARDELDRREAKHRTVAEELRESTERLEAVLDSAVDGIVLIDAIGTIQRVNPAVRRMFGYPPEELLGENVKILMPPPWRAEHDGYLSRYMATGDPRIIGIGREVEGRRRDGSTFPLDLAVSEVRYAGERFFLGTLREITARKLLEEELHQARKMEAVGRLAGGVAHDFNTLLGTIRGYGEMLLDSLPADSDDRQKAEHIHRCALRGAQLTRQLLAFSRQEEVRARPVDPLEVVEELVVMLDRLLPEDVVLERRVEPGLGRVSADPGRLQQVLLNMAINACDAMPRGGTLTLRLAPVRLERETLVAGGRLAAGEYVLLEVADTGLGMDDAVRQRIFEPFFTTKGPGEGTGLGLATAYAVVQQAGGGIAVDSRPGTGTVFRVYLPRLATPEGATVVAASTSAADLPEALERAAETVLLVEDDDMFRRLLEEVLIGQGYRVLVAADPPEALTVLAAAAELPDLLVSDLVMPGGTGVELAATLSERHPAIKVVLMSGHTDDALASRDVDPSTADAFIEKPFATRDFLRLLRHILAGRRGPAGRREPGGDDERRG